MKKREIAGVMGLAAVMLSACQGLSRATVAETCWREAAKASSLEEYVKEHKDEMDMEAFKQEADSADSTLSQKFKAIALMCSLEYEKNSGQDASWKSGAFAFDYPETSDYAETFLETVNIQGEEFWNSLGDAFSPYDCFWPVMAAADDLTGETLVNLLNNVPEDKSYGSKLEDAADQWIRANPVKAVDMGEELKKGGYYENWSSSDWTNAYVYDYGDPYRLKTDTIDEALEYIAYVKDSVLPELTSADTLKETSDILGRDVYNTHMAVTVGEELPLKEPGESLPETIDLEGKKVIAFYRNLQTEEFPGSATPLQVLGDFMLELPAEEAPSTAAEADYYLVLTPDMQEAGVYQTMGGKDTGIGMVYSNTSVDLYEASTGNFLRHLGTVTEMPPERIFASYDDENSRYQEITGADILYYIYRNLNDPMSYVSLVDDTAGRGDLAKDESVVVGDWEVAYHGAEIVPGYEKGMYRYDADEGCLLVRCSFTITNRGFGSSTFMSHYTSDPRATIVQLMDRDTEEAYTNMDVLTDSDCLTNKSLEPGESAQGQLIYQIPEAAADKRESLALAVGSGIQLVYYPLD